SSSHKVADRRPSKRLKCGKDSPIKSELGGSSSCGTFDALGETPKTPDGDQCSEDPGDHNVIQQKKGESVPETNKEEQEKERSVSPKPCAVQSSTPLSDTDSDEHLPGHDCRDDESSRESAPADGSGWEDDLPKQPVRLDNSALLDEDSNQPMPVDRFFGDVEFIQDLPAVVLPSTTMSRREFRKLHFIAKEDEEEEEDVV
ncbi:CA174 protein, partial [Syrrhaptes paradoxus]|nr:CA174 protein [Syrrhaptes paradoxus]